MTGVILPDSGLEQEICLKVSVIYVVAVNSLVCVGMLPESIYLC